MERSYMEGDSTLLKRAVATGMNLPTVHAKDADRAEIEALTRAFLRRGGKITIVPGTPSEPVPLPQSPEPKQVAKKFTDPQAPGAGMRLPRFLKTPPTPMVTMGLIGGDSLLNDVNTAFGIKGTSLGKWCKEQNESYTAARQCLLAARPRQHGVVLRCNIISASGVRDYIAARDKGNDAIAALVKKSTDPKSLAEMATAMQPGDALLDLVMRAFRGRGAFFSSWCQEQGLDIATVRRAVLGDGCGPAGFAMRGRVLVACGLAASCEKEVA